VADSEKIQELERSLSSTKAKLDDLAAQIAHLLSVVTNPPKKQNSPASENPAALFLEASKFIATISQENTDQQLKLIAALGQRDSEIRQQEDRRHRVRQQELDDLIDELGNADDAELKPAYDIANKLVDQVGIPMAKSVLAYIATVAAKKNNGNGHHQPESIPALEPSPQPETSDDPEDGDDDQ